MSNSVPPVRREVVVNLMGKPYRLNIAVSADPIHEPAPVLVMPNKEGSSEGDSNTHSEERPSPGPTPIG